MPDHFQPIKLSYITMKNTNTSADGIFLSSLFDTVKVRIQLSHEPLYEIVAKKNFLQYTGKKYQVRSRFGTFAIVASEKNRTSLTIEGSIPKFLTGQNLIGTEDLLTGTVELIDLVLLRAGILAAEAEKKRYREGTFQLLRVDYAKHVNCGTPKKARVFMTALRATVASTAYEYSAFNNETVYWGLFSNRRTLRAYNKGLEMEKHALGDKVYAATKLTREAQSMVRFELALRAEELARLNLRRASDWKVEVARELLEDFVKRLLPLDHKIPDVTGMDLLSPTLRDRLELWLRGCTDAFSRYPGSLSQARREVLLTCPLPPYQLN